jgi:hypothetical protein
MESAMAKKRVLSHTTAEATLAAAGDCRAACIRLMTEAPISSEAYQKAEALRRAVDDLAEALTGNREHFHLPPPRAG